MTHQQPCPRCHRGTPDGLLCQPCTDAYERALADLGALLPELDTVIHRQDHTARAIHHVHQAGDPVTVQADAEHQAIPARLRSRDERIALPATGMPVNVDAADLKVAVLMQLTAHAVRFEDKTDRIGRRVHGPACASCTHPSCQDARACPCGRRDCTTARPSCPDLDCGHRHCHQVRANTVPATWRLLNAVPALRRHLLAPDIVNDVLDCARIVTAAVDLRDPDMYMGPCDAETVTFAPDGEGGTIIVPGATCGVHMYGQLGDPVVECPACGTRYRVATRKRWLLQEVREVWARPGEIVKALAALDLDLTQGRLNDWIGRDKSRHARRCWPGQPCDHILRRGLDSDQVDEAGRPVGRPVYRVGDVIDRVERLRAERDARSATAAAGEVAVS